MSSEPKSALRPDAVTYALSWWRSDCPIRRGARRVVWERDNRQCGICGEPVAWADLQVDHIQPVMFGGTNDATNLRAAHAWCNIRRGRAIATAWHREHPIMKTRACRACGTEFTNTHWFRYCSNACTLKASRQRRASAQDGGGDG